MANEASLRRRLIGLYAELAAHTEPECAAHCAKPRTCCEAQYCALAIDHAKSHWHVDLVPTWHAALPLMGDDGCTAAAHLRPICTAHTCAVCEHGTKPGDPAWTARYQTLTRTIETIEAELFDDCEHAPLR